MRLINVHSLHLEAFQDAVPPYAILSHTWGEEELTFEDLTHTQNPQKKIANSKLQGLARVTRSHDLQYVWLDTCCIDKSSSAELSEAINSMYRWYQDSQVCYAYLSDIAASTDLSPIDEASLRQSRWFARGWTLQELLAPRKVLFFDQQWNLRGSKTKQPMLGILSRITHIDEDILLDGNLIPEVSVAQRMSWASQRTTTRPEDIGYCLMGLFSVSLPVIYGCGRNTFVQLQEEILKDLDELSLFAWASSPQGKKFSGILAGSPSDFSHIWTLGCCWRQPSYFNGDMFSTSKGLSIVADFVSLGSELVLDLGNLGGGPHRYGILLVEVNGVFVRLSPELVLVGKHGEYFPVAQDNSREESPGHATEEISVFRTTFLTNERTISMKAVLKRVLDGRTTKFLQQKFKTRSPWSSGAGAFRALTSRRSRHKQQRYGKQEQRITSKGLGSEPEDTLSQEPWYTVEKPNTVGSSSVVGWPRIIGWPQDSRKRPHSADSESWGNVSLTTDRSVKVRLSPGSHFNSQPKKIRNIEGRDSLSSDRQPCQLPLGTIPSHRFLAGKEELLYEARIVFEGWLGAIGHRSALDEAKVNCEDAERIGKQHLLSAVPAMLACPYWKRDAVRYHACLHSEEFSEVQDISQHLWDEHRQPPYCPICFEEFTERSAWGGHVRRQECDDRPPRNIEGIRDDQKDLIDAAAEENWTMEEKWFAIWDAAFPGQERPGSPYLDGKVGFIAALARKFWKEQGQQMVSEFARCHNLLRWKTAGEERGLRTLYEAVLVDLIDLLVRQVEDGYDAMAIGRETGNIDNRQVKEEGSEETRMQPLPSSQTKYVTTDDTNDLPEGKLVRHPSEDNPEPSAAVGTSPRFYHTFDGSDRRFDCYHVPTRQLPTRLAAPCFDIPDPSSTSGPAISSHSILRTASMELGLANMARSEQGIND